MTSILIVDDSENIRKQVEEILTTGRVCDTVLVAKNGAEALRTLGDQDVDLVLCDVNMPLVDGVKFLAIKASRGEYDDLPVIMLTGRADLKERIRCLQVGASDYLTKPFHEQELIARVRVHLQNRILQKTLKEKNAQLEKLSLTDPLTQLANRRHLMDRLEDELKRARRYAKHLGCCMLDIDHFKSVNDSHGHPVGDQVLKIVANCLEKTIRDSDLAGRYGGEEFVLILPEQDLQGAETAAERCRISIRESNPVVDGVTITVTSSFGVACFVPGIDVSAAALLQAADEALYRAKENGRDRVETATVNDIPKD